MKVLVADDSLVMRRLLESSLAGWGYEVVCASDGSQAWEILSAPDAPRIAILDWMMPGQSGLEICRMVRAANLPPYTYIILLTSRGMREDIVEGMNAGADDYVVKPFDRHELEVRLRAGKRIIDLHLELMRTQEALREQATRDPLTGIWNRTIILEVLHHELDRSMRDRRPVGALMVDLDHFKDINDTHGHQFGDQALRAIAARIQATVRSYDSFGRYGGEEFLVVAPGCNEGALLAQAERLRRAISTEPFEIEGQSFHITISVGASAAEPAENSITPDDLVRAADAALYEAKRTGRNKVVFLAPAAFHRLD